MGAIEELDARHAAAARAAERDATRLNKQVNEQRETAKEEFDESEQGDNTRQIAEAERLMRLSTPETLRATGAVVPWDVTRFPSD